MSATYHGAHRRQWARLRLIRDRRVRVYDSGALELRGARQILVRLVPGEVKQEERRQQNSGGADGRFLGAAGDERAREASALDDSVRRRLLDAAEDGRSSHRTGERERVVVE